jgi:hypothetical protein
MGRYRFRRDFDNRPSGQAELYNFAGEVYPRVYSFLACFIKAAWYKALDIQMKRI